MKQEQSVAAGPKAQDITVDVLVVGSGTGMAAALAAHEQGLSVVIIEKTDLVGGSTARSGGAFWVPGNIALQRGGADLSRNDAERYLTNVVKDTSPPERYKAFLDHGPAAVGMLERMTRLRFFWAKGYADYHPDQPGGSDLGRTCESRPFDIRTLGSERGRFRSGDVGAPLPMPVTGADYRWVNLMLRKPLKAWPRIIKRVVQGLGGMLIGRHYVAGGQAIAAGMFEGVVRAGIPLWTRTSLIDLVKDGERVAGAIVEQDGQRQRIVTQRGVILATGGFDHNMAMRRHYQSPSLVDDNSLGAEGNVGDGITLGQSLGAGVKLMEESWWFPAVPSPKGGYPSILLAERSLPGSFIVDQQGRRFLNEAMDYMSFGQTCLRLEKEGTPVGQMWLVLDQANRNSYLLATSVMPRAPLPQDWYDKGIAVKAENPRDLARAAGLPEDAFAATVERFNADAAQGTDTLFHRGENAYDRYYGDPTVTPNPNLRPLSGTLYAVKLVLSDLGTCGGLMADEKARVQRSDGSVIPGLYAIGNTAGNAFGRVYPGAGATIGQGLAFGYIAAHHIANQARS